MTDEAKNDAKPERGGSAMNEETPHIDREESFLEPPTPGEDVPESEELGEVPPEEERNR